MYDFGKTLAHGGRALVIGAVAVVGAWLADPLAVEAALEESVRPVVIVAAVPVINALGEMLRNAVKHGQP